MCQFEEGPKNPLEGTTVNPLVFALNAQFGVDAGGKNAMFLRTQGDLQWHGDPDPVSVETRTCAWAYDPKWYFAPCTMRA